MNIQFKYGRNEIELSVPDDSIIYDSEFPRQNKNDSELVMDSVRKPINSPPLKEILERRDKGGKVAIAVSDITRPVPYSRFLPELLAEVESANIAKDEILIIIATGMHRPSTADERLEMFGRDIVSNYKIIDHKAESDSELLELPEKSWSGNKIKINRCFAEAGFKIITGLVEPHFMAGFSGGRKAVCPGLASLETIKKFHGYEFLSNPLACNGNLRGNPCHEESLSVAKLANVDFSINVVLNEKRQLVKCFAGELEKAHSAACDFVSKCSCPKVKTEADIALTSCGGYPLDATFYQCVKGMVSCLPAVKRSGIIISFGGCCEGIGNKEYQEMMEKYSGKWRDFLNNIGNQSAFIKDQWEFQMQCRVLEKTGRNNLYFITDGLNHEKLDKLSVNGISVKKKKIREEIQKVFDKNIKKGMKVAVFPEGPYCAPIS